MKWSHSSLKDFETCARKHYEVKVLKKYPRVETEATHYGTALHKAAEDYLVEAVPLAREYAYMQPILEIVDGMEGMLMCEHEMGVRIDLSPCAFDDEDVWSRGIADLLIINDETGVARCIDWKTGNDRYPDTDQLVLMALMTFAHFPGIDRVKGALAFVLKGTLVRKEILRVDADKHWQRYRERVALMEQAHRAGHWPESPNGLCRKHCEVTDCPYNGRTTYV